MLVLSRKLQQSIRIGDSVTITILRVTGKTVRIGIEAPDNMKIIRSELPDYTIPIQTPEATAAGSYQQPQVRGNRIASFAPSPLHADDDQKPLGLSNQPLMAWESSEPTVSRPR